MKTIRLFGVFFEIFGAPLHRKRKLHGNTPLDLPTCATSQLSSSVPQVGCIRQRHTHRGSSAGKAKGKLRKATLHFSNNTRIMQFYPADFIRGFPHPSASHEPVGQIKASGAHPFPSGTEESRGVAVLTQKEKEQSRDKAGFSW